MLKKRLKYILHQEKGAGYIGAIIVMVTLSLAAFSLVNVHSTDVQIADDFEQSYSAFSVGNAGIVYARNVLNNGGDPVVSNKTFEGEIYPNTKKGIAEVYTYTANQEQNLPGTMIIRDADNPDEVSQDVDAKRIYHSSKRDYLLFLKKYYGIESMDDRGVDHYHSVHYGIKYNNAFMNGKQMAYGDGDGENFNTFAWPDIGIHENSHLKTQELAGSEEGLMAMGTQLLGGLIYRGQSGALNEHYSDFDAIFVYLSQVTAGTRFEDLDREFWLVGANLLVRPKQDGAKAALRSFLNELAYDDPRLGTDSQPKHMKDYYDGSRDNHGVHINSGIINHGSYLAFKYLADMLDIDVLTAVQIQTAVWHKALTRMHNRTTFKEAVRHWLKAAQELFPEVPQIHEAIKKAFEEVGVIGAQAETVDHVIELVDDFDANEFNVNENDYKNILDSIDQNRSDIEQISGFSHAGIGARIDNGNVELVMMIFVDEIDHVQAYPNDIAGYDVVIRRETPIIFESEIDLSHENLFQIDPNQIRYMNDGFGD